MPLSQSTPLYLWAYSVHFGLACFGSPLLDGDDHVSQSDFATRKIAGFFNDHFDGVIVAVIANPSESERSYWNDRTESEWQNAIRAERNESPSVTALNDALDTLFGAKSLLEDGLDIQSKCEDYPCCGCCTISDDGWNGYIYE